MNKIINFSVVMLLLILTVSCYEKDENYEYKP